MLKIGVLSYQGDVSEHMDMVRAAGCEPVAVKDERSLASVGGLVLPGGESTCQGKLLKRFGLDAPIIEQDKSRHAGFRDLHGRDITCPGNRR